MPKRVVKLRTATKCSICGAGDDVRDRVDAVLARVGEIDPATGAKLRWAWALEVVLPHLLGKEISMTSVRRHLGTYRDGTPHTSLVDDEEEAEKLEAAAASVETGELLDQLDEILASDTVSPTAVLGLQLRAWALSLRRKVALGEEITMTSDQAQRAASVLLKSEHQAAEQSLIGLLASGLSRGFEHAMSAGRQGHALPRGMPEIVEHEPLDVEDADVVPPASPPPPSRPVSPIPIEDAPARAPAPEVVEDERPDRRERFLRRSERPGGYREGPDSG